MQYVVDIYFHPPYIVTHHVVSAHYEGASGSKGRSRKSPILFSFAASCTISYLWNFHVQLVPHTAVSMYGRFYTQRLPYIAMPEENSTLVKIFNHQYQVASDEGGGDRVARVASYLDEKMHDASTASGKTAPLEVAVMAAMEIAHEVLVGREKKEALLDQADERISSFAKRLEGEAGTESGSLAPLIDEEPPDEGSARF